MDPSSSDLEFFDFKNSSDEEIKEIQAILKGPGSNGCVELPWEISARNNYSGSLPENEGAVLETVPDSAKSAKDVDETAAQTLNFVASQTLLPPLVAQLPPPTVETFVSLPTTVGPYQNAPYFVSRTIPYLRAYPPMGVPFFACPMPGTGEANPYGQFVPMAPERPAESEPGPKSRDRQSSRRSSKKRLSGMIDAHENMNAYPDGSTTTCPTSIPLVPLPVPPSTFVGGNLPLHGYPPGLHTSPAMYYVPVFNHPYGGYLPPTGPPMMLPVKVATDVAELKCLPHDNGGSMEMLQTDNGDLEALQTKNYGESPRSNSGGPLELPQTPHGSPLESHQTDFGGLGESLQTNNGCSEELLPTDNGSSEKVLQTTYNPVVPVSFVKETTPNVQSDCKVGNLPDIADTQPVNPTAKINAPETEERMDSSDSLSGPLSEGSCTNCFQETEKCLEETVPSKVHLTETVSAKTPLLEPEAASAKDCRPATEKVKQVVRDQSRCWADLFKGPPREMNGFEAPSKKSTFDNSKKDITNGKVYSVPASNSLH